MKRYLMVLAVTLISTSFTQYVILDKPLDEKIVIGMCICAAVFSILYWLITKVLSLKSSDLKDD